MFTVVGKYLIAFVLVSLVTSRAIASDADIVIGPIRAGAKRLIRLDDVAALRHIDTLTISPDGQRFAIFVRQGIPEVNEYRTGWFVGTIRGEPLVYVGNGGGVEADEVGAVAGRAGRWSPDGRWIAYALKDRDGEVHLWCSSVDGETRRQLTRNAADVQEFDWSEDGQKIFFTVGESRANQRKRDLEKGARGYNYDRDIYSFSDFMRSPMRREPETDRSLWTVTFTRSRERLGGDQDRAAFVKVRERAAAGVAALDGFYEDGEVSRILRADGASTWLVREAPASRRLRVVAALSARSPTIKCPKPECSGIIVKVWWSSDGERVFFWRREGINERTHAFYAWSPSTNRTTTIVRTPDDDLRQCAPTFKDQLLCVRETPTRPAHVIAIDMKSGGLQVLADVNPEFQNIRLGRAERIEWDLPKFDWNEPGGKLEGLYGEKSYGYVLYPPDFDATRKYPVFVDPYIANGFNRPGSEHPLHVYAASGFVVLNTSFPFPSNETMERLGSAAAREFYSPVLGYPDLAMLSDSTLRSLDALAARGFVDEHRVGIGGVSMGTVIPLYIMQRHDRIAAISISSPHWGPFQYYWNTRKGRDALAASYGKIGYDDFIVKPTRDTQEFWNGIDMAEHVDAIEAPVLMHLAAGETFALLRLLRHMEEARKPYDAYVFPNEAHIKWQPAHLQAIMSRNLDWFRFWLQEYEDSDPQKAEQYSHWKELRRQHNEGRGGSVDHNRE